MEYITSGIGRALKEAHQEKKLPKAVIIVNLYGQVARMDELMAICNHYGVPVIEDAAESLGASYKGKASGSFYSACLGFSLLMVIKSSRHLGAVY